MHKLVYRFQPLVLIDYDSVLVLGPAFPIAVLDIASQSQTDFPKFCDQSLQIEYFKEMSVCCKSLGILCCLIGQIDREVS